MPQGAGVLIDIAALHYNREDQNLHYFLHILIIDNSMQLVTGMIHTLSSPLDSSGTGLGMPLFHLVPVCLCRTLDCSILIESSNRCSCLFRKKVRSISFVESRDTLPNTFENADFLKQKVSPFLLCCCLDTKLSYQMGLNLPRERMSKREKSCWILNMVSL